MTDIQKIAREAGFYMNQPDYDYSAFNEMLSHFAALIREAVVAELVAGSGESDGYRIGKDGEREDVYTADQLARAVLREREHIKELEAQNTALLEALKMATSFKEGGKEMARAAIAQAEGEVRRDADK